MNRVCIALDAMGGDHGPSVVVPAAIDALKEHAHLDIILVGKEEVILPFIKKHHASLSSRLKIVNASEEVSMGEQPAVALRSKKDSSMRKAIDLVKSGEAGACVSAGNTGALMAIAKFVLKTLPGIDRPAIVYSIPTEVGKGEYAYLRMLDLGANVDCNADHLVQFAVMGSALSQAVDHHPSPRVGLLNIGQEAIKGSDTVKQAALQLKETNMVNYIGFVEGNDIYLGKADVVVCDGFLGNVSLKTAEGVAGMLVGFLRHEFKRNIFTKIAAAISWPIIGKLMKRFDPSNYNGATFLGLTGVVIKSHGNAERKGFKTAIDEAIFEAQSKVPELIGNNVASHLGNFESA